MQTRLGYTCLGTSSSGSSGGWAMDGVLWAGTADARLCMLDVNRHTVVADWMCGTSLRYDGDESVVAVCANGVGIGGEAGIGSRYGAGGRHGIHWVAAGNRHGQLVLVDSRCGVLLAVWQAHELEITSLAAVSPALLVSASQVRWEPKGSVLISLCPSLGHGRLHLRRVDTGFTQGKVTLVSFWSWFIASPGSDALCLP